MSGIDKLEECDGAYGRIRDAAGRIVLEVAAHSAVVYRHVASGYRFRHEYFVFEIEHAQLVARQDGGVDGFATLQEHDVAIAVDIRHLLSRDPSGERGSGVLHVDLPAHMAVCLGPHHALSRRVVPSAPVGQ